MDLDVIEQRANAATEGPWEYDGRTLWGRDDIGRIKAVTPEDRVFTAAARTDVPDLVARVRELEAENEKLRDDLGKLHMPLSTDWGWETVCSECGEDYPCPTMKLVE